MRTLWWVGIGEALTLLLLVGNRVTVDAPSLSQGVGPLHGLLYLDGVVDFADGDLAGLVALGTGPCVPAL